MEDNARLKEWQAKWEEGDAGTPWQKNDVHGTLIKYGLPLLEGGPKRCFIPLCGRTLDLKFLYDEGHIVVGLEGVELAVRDFFELNAIPYTVKETPAKHYETPDERLRIYVTDIFTINPHVLGTFNFIWDRGGLVAVYLKDRPKYSKIMKSLPKTNCKYLIESVFYNGLEAPLTGGPPRCITDEEFEDLFGDTFIITHLDVTEADAQAAEKLGLDRVWRRRSVLAHK